MPSLRPQPVGGGGAALHMRRRCKGLYRSRGRAVVSSAGQMRSPVRGGRPFTQKSDRCWWAGLWWHGSPARGKLGSQGAAVGNTVLRYRSQQVCGKRGVPGAAHGLGHGSHRRQLARQLSSLARHVSGAAPPAGHRSRGGGVAGLSKAGKRRNEGGNASRVACRLPTEHPLHCRLPPLPARQGCTALSHPADTRTGRAAAAQLDKGAAEQGGAGQG